MADLSDIVIDNISEGINKTQMLVLHIPIDCIDAFSYGMLHDRACHLLGTELQQVLLQRRSFLKST